MTFYLGAPEPAWLGRTDVPLFLSRRRLARRRTLPRAGGPWALDSGGFTELSLFGRWQTTPRDYAAEVRRWSETAGRHQWAAIQDWMCEPALLQHTGLTVLEHQRRTLESYLCLMALDPDLPWLPVLQGWAPADYARHLDLYARAGVDLSTLPLVGLGSVCRRQHTDQLTAICACLAPAGLPLHAFGVKWQGRARCAAWLTSSDSMAWSFHARRSRPLPGCLHANCANCLTYALRWRERFLAAPLPPAQLSLPLAA